MKLQLIGGLSLGFLIIATQVHIATPQQPGPQTGARGGGRGAIDPRVQERTYPFKETNEQLPYAVFVSTKVTKDKKNPLIIALHGLGGDQNTMMRGNALQLAEESGYILVGPMGYNSGGWYGAPARFGSGGGRGGPARLLSEAVTGRPGGRPSRRSTSRTRPGIRRSHCRRNCSYGSRQSA